MASGAGGVFGIAQIGQMLPKQLGSNGVVSSVGKKGLGEVLKPAKVARN